MRQDELDTAGLGLVSLCAPGVAAFAYVHLRFTVTASLVTIPAPTFHPSIPLQIQTVEARLTLTLEAASTSCVHGMVIPGAPNLYKSAMHPTCRYYARDAGMRIRPILEQL